MIDLLLYNGRILQKNNLNNNLIIIKSGKITDILNISKQNKSDLSNLSHLIAQAKTSMDLKNKWVTPGLIDCHTHLVFAGDRQQEFSQRLSGISYEQISKKGGGIKFTVNQTRLASFEELKFLAEARLKQMIANGVTTIEIKSGYGLDLDSEVKILKVADYLAKNYPVTIQKTFLGAHTVPIEYTNKPKEYIKYITDIILPELIKNNLVDAVDSFCESIGFTTEQLRPLYQKSREYNLKIKGHTEQLSKMGGAELIGEFNGLSCDHLEYADLDTVKLLKNKNITAVLLPGAYYYLSCTNHNNSQKPPIDLLREFNVPIAIATDFNPGTSPVLSLPIIMNMACVLYRLTPEEVWDSVTINAARALGLDKTLGSIEINKQADLVIWDFNHPNDVCYYLGGNWEKTIIKNGEVINKI